MAEPVVPAEGVIPYDLNSALFSDYAEKFRFVKLPPGTHATYRDADAFEFPVGTVIAKTFAYPRDARDPSKGRRLIETRLLTAEERAQVDAYPARVLETISPLVEPEVRAWLLEVCAPL